MNLTVKNNFYTPFKGAFNLKPAENFQNEGVELRALEKDVFQKKEPQKLYSLTEKKLILPKKGQIQNQDGTIFARSTTSMFREDINWRELGRYLNQRFQDKPKVNTYVYACSTGSEAYTLSILLQKTMKEQAEKFFPIIAKDIDERVVARAIARQQEARTNANNSSFLARKALDFDEEELKKYFEPVGECPCDKVVCLTDRVKSPVIFKEGNILEDLENIDPKVPSIVMMRNMWPYVDPKEYKTFAKALYKRLAKGSCVVVGEYDHTGEEGRRKSGTFPKHLKNAGFTPYRQKLLGLETALIFEKN